VEGIERLLHAGANFEVENKYHAVPLHMATLRLENAEAVEVLLAEYTRLGKSPPDVTRVDWKGYLAITTPEPSSV